MLRREKRSVLQHLVWQHLTFKNLYDYVIEHDFRRFCSMISQLFRCNSITVTKFIKKTKYSISLWSYSGNFYFQHYKLKIVYKLWFCNCYRFLWKKYRKCNNYCVMQPFNMIYFFFFRNQENNVNIIHH